MAVSIQLPSGETVSLERQTILIGRRKGCDVCLAQGVALQQQHAKLRRVGDRWLIESQGEWLMQINESPPARQAWVRGGDFIKLTPLGPAIVFNPALTDSAETKDDFNEPAAEPNESSERTDQPHAIANARWFNTRHQMIVLGVMLVLATACIIIIGMFLR